MYFHLLARKIVKKEKSSTKKLNSKFIPLQQEAAIYIRNLVKKYGSFTYAKPKTTLNVQMIERHLFDMIPNAWKQLGRINIPKTKPIPARRKSIAASKIVDVEFAPPISGSGRIISRRASTFHHAVPSTPMNNIINYRQSIRLNEFQQQQKPSTKETQRVPIPKIIIKLNGELY